MVYHCLLLFSTANCAMYSPAGDPQHYIVNELNQIMACPSGTLFDSVTCQCLSDGQGKSPERTVERVDMMYVNVLQYNISR